MTQPDFHLIAHVLCPYVQRSIITLKEKDIPYTRTDINLAKKPPWFKQKSPLGKVPILLVDEEYTLFESAIICEYLNEITPASLHPVDNLEKAHHRAWIEFGSSILNKISSLYNANEAPHFQRIHTEIQDKFGHIEAELNDGPFFSGEKFHLIDAVYGPIFRYFDVFDTFADLGTFDTLPKCQLWRSTLQQRKSVQQAVSQDYPDLLIKFLIARESYLSKLIKLKKISN
ncbi:glutathione S-transferase family protein [Aliikangiella coralliicola]|uniref:glutathione transferase n=1 Tax=Aliikangiella coralliicola TaxID=2592383 RepID=A0A545UIJ6_9GAMM|nr:glutathione S-transferase family protein [Aliikangiella coralliicola]TQV89280.1 glutathione S-transferase family protein [Aliikangiella coralliicola]